MSHRFFVYPLLVVVLLQLIPMLRNEPRWFLAEIFQHFLILIAGGIALGESHHNFWIITAWGLCFWFVAVPKLLMHGATRWLLSGETNRAAVAWRNLARLTWGQSARLNRRVATALDLWSAGNEPGAELLLKQLDDQSVPDSVRGELRLWHLWLLISNRQWQRAVDFYEGVGSWGMLGTALQARLSVARAAAELGQLARAIQYVFVVAVSPRTMGALSKQLRATQVCVASLAGDKEELERLLAERPVGGRGSAWFAAVWRGRCALRRGEREEAGQQFTRALALTPANLPKSRTIIRGYLEKMEVGTVAPDESLRPGLAMLRDAEQRLAPWRDLIGWSRPGIGTAGLLILITAVFIGESVNLTGDDQQYIDWGGNVPLSAAASTWWRPVTALFLHANWLHLVMNASGLWMFGTAIEKTRGWIRMLVIFLVAGTLANVASAYKGGFDVSVGASGAIFGLVGAFGVTVYRLKAPIPESVRRRLLVTLALMVSVDLTIGGLEANIDNIAHIGGLVSGILLALIP